MSDSSENAITWSAYVCPDCRFVFRLPKSHEESEVAGVICPSCERLLKIPTGDQLAPPLVVPPSDSHSSTSAAKRKRVRKRRKKAELLEEWSDAVPAVQDEKIVSRRSGAMGQLVVTGTLLGGIAIVIALFMQPDEAAETEPFVPVEPEVKAMADTDPMVTDEQVEKEIALWFDKQEVLELCRSFLDAKRVEEILPLVRHAERLAPEIRRYHAEDSLDASGLRSMEVAKVIQDDHWNVVSLKVSTDSYDIRPLHVVGTEDGPKVDWESWVGHGELPWEEFLQKKPHEPKLMRGMLSEVNYYNMDFMDERRWISVRLRSADDLNTIYGYVERNSALGEKIGLLLRSLYGEECRATFKIRFLENAQSRNQVILEEFIAADWLLPDPTS